MMTSYDLLTASAVDHLAALVGFDTTSRRSNLELIAYVEAQLSELGVASRRVSSRDGAKANLLATLGPTLEGGIVLSGHTDVVPVDGQPWSSDPFVLTERQGRLYGRGTCDMKGFLALALAGAPLFLSSGLRRPVHLAFSYDEEVGCLGAPELIAEIAAELPRPSAVIVGEPTCMEVVRGHKGISVFKVTVRGKAAHSSLTHLGVSANMAAVRLMDVLNDLAEALEHHAAPDSPFTPPHATLTIGEIRGGTATNILAAECVFSFDLRCPPGVEVGAILAPFRTAVDVMDRDLRARATGAGASLECLASVPAFGAEANGRAESLARGLTGDNGPGRVVSYAAEAGQFQQAGFSTVICGPGSIEQAHQADEYLEVNQMEKGAEFMRRLAQYLSSD